MICVSYLQLEARAKALPVAYLADCRAVAVIEGDNWCFAPKDYLAIRGKYRGFAVSQVDGHGRGEPISGCCDRADQY
jgi:hypothetical protein